MLVGVIMFVLALTILGLSLYGLSGFEVGFLSSTLDRDQAFYDASGGLDRARWIMTRKGTLEAVKQAIPYGDGVVYARAWYADTGDSTGAIRWDQPERPVSVRVLALRGGGARPGSPEQRCLLTCRYTPLQLRDIYTNVATAAGGIWIAGSAPPSSVVLAGNVWLNSHDASWRSRCTLSGTATLDGVPPPAVADFLLRFPSPYPATGVESHAGHGRGHGPNWVMTYSFDAPGLSAGGSSGARVFRGSSGPPDPDNQYAVWSPARDLRTTIQMSGAGTVLWVVPGGIRFRGALSVNGGPGDRLVIVASPGTESARPPFDATPVGIRFDGAVTAVDATTPLPVILVTDGTIAFDPAGIAPANATLLPWVSLYATHLYLDPTGSPGPLTLAHNASMDSAALDDLIRDNLLPNVTPEQNRALVPIAGSWSQVLTSNPDDPD